MTDEQFTKLLPIVGTAVSVIGGLTLNYINERRESLRKKRQDNDAQALVNRIAETSQAKIEFLEAEARLKDAELRLRDEQIAALQRKLDASEDNDEREVNLESDMG